MGDANVQSLILTQFYGSAGILTRLPEQPRHKSSLPSLASTWISIENWVLFPIVGQSGPMESTSEQMSNNVTSVSQFSKDLIVSLLTMIKGVKWVGWVENGDIKIG
ncbi:hypothetical protein KY285_010291 [Solanum tuberosum]|nr:hypothetical protein KY285_010291 [Solanum tuberosum]